jgi:hypothetical protein
MSFWSDEINLKDLRSPAEILQDAGTELRNRTESRLDVQVIEISHSDRSTLVFQVENLSTRKTLGLFDVSHQLETPYPAVINPPNNTIPEFLKKKRFVPGTTGFGTGGALAAFTATMGKVLEGEPGKHIENNWVASTPTEFKRLLTELLSRDDIKSRIIALLSDSGNGTSKDTIDSDAVDQVESPPA